VVKREGNTGVGKEGWGRRRRCGEGGGSLGDGVEGGEVSGGARVWTHSFTSVTEEVCVTPPSEVFRRGGNQAGLELGVGWVEVALAKRQTMGRPYLDDTA
jgi:hypothetical protein